MLIAVVVLVSFAVGVVAGALLITRDIGKTDRVEKDTARPPSLDEQLRRRFGLDAQLVEELLVRGERAKAFWTRYRAGLGLMQCRGRREEGRAEMAEAERELDAMFEVRMPPAVPSSQPVSCVRARENAAGEELEAANG